MNSDKLDYGTFELAAPGLVNRVEIAALMSAAPTGRCRPTNPSRRPRPPTAVTEHRDPQSPCSGTAQLHSLMVAGSQSGVFDASSCGGPSAFVRFVRIALAMTPTR